MTPEKFVAAYYPFAEKSEKYTGISAIATLAQAATESAWGEHAPGNNFFGIKASKDTPEDKRQLITTTEYHKTATIIYPEVISVIEQPNGLYKYKVKDWFKKYDTPEESFADHAQFFLSNERYKAALTVKDNPEKFIDAIAHAGYATDTHYADLLKSVAKTIERFV